MLIINNECWILLMHHFIQIFKRAHVLYLKADSLQIAHLVVETHAP
jgi:hypothetical protein